MSALLHCGRIGLPKRPPKLLPSVTLFGLLLVSSLSLSLPEFRHADFVEAYIIGVSCLGAFAAMALLGKIDQILAPKGVSITIAPLGAVCAVLFATPTSPGARKYNMFVAQIGCAAIGALAFSILGPGWLARSTALAAAMAFMIFTRSVHPPAASLPLLFIDGVKLHHLNFWYALFPGAAGCIVLCLIQEMVCYLKDNMKF